MKEGAYNKQQVHSDRQTQYITHLSKSVGEACDKWLEKRGMKTRIVSTVHDSLEIISPDEEISEACEIIYNEMVNYPYIKKHFGLSFNVPLEIEILIGDSFGDGEEYFVESINDN